MWLCERYIIMKKGFFPERKERLFSIEGLDSGSWNYYFVKAYYSVQTMNIPAATVKQIGMV